MSLVSIVVRELAHRRWNSLLTLLALVATVALFVAYLTTAEASKRETTRITRDIGFNLRIIAKDTDMDRFWTLGYSDQTMPEESVRNLANHQNVFFAYNHLVASLEQKIPLQGRELLLTGLAPAITAPGQGKQPMGFAIKPGTLHLGYQVAQWLHLKKQDSLELGGRKFQIEKCLAEQGTSDDIRIFGLLSDVQAVLQLEGRINEIKAIDCLCMTGDQDPLKILREELAKALPDTKVVQLRSIADARARQRQMVDKYFALATPFLLAVCAAWIGVLAVVNVRERKIEIGVLRALGYRSGRIAGMVFAKAILLGIIGALLGYALGSSLALKVGPGLFQLTAKSIQPVAGLLWQALLCTPLFAAVATFVPAMMAIAQDPAETLREA